jgi:hypothetical protein
MRYDVKGIDMTKRSLFIASILALGVGLWGCDDDPDPVDGGGTVEDGGGTVEDGGGEVDGGTEMGALYAVSPDLAAAGTPPAGVPDSSATYFGAVNPDGSDDWYSSWARFDDDEAPPYTDLPTGCPEPSARVNIETVDADITADTTWSCDTIYVIDGTVFVTSGTLTIERGTWIESLSAEGQASALVVTQGAEIEAVGTAGAPIVFTSANVRSGDGAVAGDWGGLVLLGSGTINSGGGTDNIEGLPPGEAQGSYGGDDPTSDCGTLSYVRVEYAGFVFGEDNELNGITFGGCGSDTQLSFLESYGGQDDGMEFFGGSADLDHGIVVGTGDDSLDYDQGYDGTIQFFLSIQNGAAGEDNCIEASSGGTNPATSAIISNYSCIGATGGGQNGFRMNTDAGGTISNSFIVGVDALGLRLQGNETLGRIIATPPTLVFQQNILFGPGGDRYALQPPDEGSTITADDLTAITAALDAAFADTDPMVTLP